MPPKGAVNHATNLRQLLKVFADAFATSQDQLSKAYDDLASGYLRYDSKLPKARPRIPFGEWAAREIESRVLHRVLEARFGSHWDSLKRSEQARRVQGLNALGLQHPGELYLWYGEAAVASRQAWLDLGSINVTAATLFSEIVAARAEKYTRPPHYLRTAITPSEVISAKKRLARVQEADKVTGASTKEGVKPKDTTDDCEDEPEEEELQRNHVAENIHTSVDTRRGVATPGVRDSASGGSDVRETPRNTTINNRTQGSLLHDLNGGQSYSSDREEEYDFDESPPQWSIDETPAQEAMPSVTDKQSGAGMGVRASRMSPRTEVASPDDSAIDMGEADKGEKDAGHADNAVDQPGQMDEETPHHRQQIEAEPANAVETLEVVFQSGLELIRRTKQCTTRHEYDEQMALTECDELRKKMTDLNQQLVARAAELLRAADGPDDEWAKCSEGQLVAGEWEKELVEAGGKKRKRAEDASTSRSKRTKFEACAKKAMKHLGTLGKALDELEDLCKAD